MYQQSHIQPCLICIVSNETFNLNITLEINAESARNNDTPSYNSLAFPSRVWIDSDYFCFKYLHTEDDI